MEESDNRRGVVGSFDEWSPLEEVIVGTALGACVPEPDPWVRACVSSRNVPWLERFGGTPFPRDILEPAQHELDGLAETLRALGIAVRRPEPLDHCQLRSTPHFEGRGLYAAMPRDILSVLGGTLLEAPMAWRQRHFEHEAYRPLVERYAAAGATRLRAPQPLRRDDLYRSPGEEGSGPFVTTEREPCFDAAEIIRCGRDLFTQRSQVTNLAGIRWLRDHLPAGFRLHRLSFDDPNPMHMDSTLMPLRPGLMLVNPSRPCHQRDLLEQAGWRLVEAPPPALPTDWPLFLSSPWLSMNLLVIDPRRVVVEREERATIRQLRALGFETIELPFRHVYTLGGGFHCATCDVRRRRDPADDIARYRFPGCGEADDAVRAGRSADRPSA
ncbi:amidinotransferase [Endothiovibrio diazotrophicus]